MTAHEEHQPTGSDPGAGGDPEPAGELREQADTASAEETPTGSAEPASTPYGSLWIPLIVVPAGIVISIVLVFSLFGLISGEEASLADNLARVVNGGTNERDQALFNIARQVGENQKALAKGDEPPWEVPRGFSDEVRLAVDKVGDAYEARLTLAILLGTLGDPSGADLLLEVLALDDSSDPDGKLRFGAAVNLFGDERARPLLLQLAGHEDEGLRGAAMITLRSVPGDGVAEALLGGLADSALSVRGNAAISLAELEPGSEDAAQVLIDLLEPEAYERERERDPTKFRRKSLVSTTRVEVARALAGMTAPSARVRLEELRTDDDLELREAALEALSGAED